MHLVIHSSRDGKEWMAGTLWQGPYGRHLMAGTLWQGPYGRDLMAGTTWGQMEKFMLVDIGNPMLDLFSSLNISARNI